MGKAVKYIARDGFLKRDIGGEAVLVPTGERANEFNGMISLGESGVTIWDAIESPKTVDELVAIMNEEYEIPDDVDVKSDVEEFLKYGIQCGAIVKE